MVGTSGIDGERVAVVTASARTVPLWIFLVSAGTPSIIMTTRPDIRSGSTATVPRYGTWTMSTWAFSLNSSVARCTAVPVPDEP